MSDREEVAPDEFGEIRSIESKQTYDMEPFMMMAARGLLSGDFRPMIELEEATTYKVEFPVECEITVTYDDYKQGWSAWYVPADKIKEITDTWNDCPIYIQATHGSRYNGGYKDSWYKFVCGYEFRMNYYSYTKEIES